MAGIIKLQLRGYILATFWGTLVRSFVYLYFGFTSVGALTALNEGLDSLESVGYVVLALLLGGLIAYFYYLRSRGAGLSMVERITKEQD